MSRPKIVLLVEDDPDHAELAMITLHDNEIPNWVYHVNCGEEAMSFLRREKPHYDKPRPDIVLLDLKLPRMDGHEVLAAVKGDEDLRLIPVVVLSTSASERDKARAYALNANSYLVKPADFDDLRSLMASLKLYWLRCNQSATLPSA